MEENNMYDMYNMRFIKAYDGISTFYRFFINIYVASGKFVMYVYDTICVLHIDIFDMSGLVNMHNHFGMIIMGQKHNKGIQTWHPRKEKTIFFRHDCFYHYCKML